MIRIPDSDYPQEYETHEFDTVVMSEVESIGTAGDDVASLKVAIELLQAEVARANAARQRAEQMVRLSPSTLFLLEFKSRKPIFVNRSVLDTLGYTREQLASFGDGIIEKLSHPSDLVFVEPRFAALAVAADGEVHESTRRFRHADGRWIWILARETVFSRYPDGTPREILINASDITALKEAEERLDMLARRDSLTGLANLRMIKERLRTMLAERARGRPGAVLMIDVDHFKRLNDEHGHVVGNQMLVVVAELFRTGVSVTDLAGRYGGEEFCLLLSDVGESGAVQMAEKLRGALRRVSSPSAVTASFGVTEISDADVTPESVIQRADRALYRAKRAGRDRVEVERTSSQP
ncbi:MAG: sensor domain-containing diguanylate cyclase [Gemmatimonadaceae bacterium]|nr:sensor domain-containing diguanylate cyclase [Gemmatimonadaceae bacterium]